MKMVCVVMLVVALLGLVAPGQGQSAADFEVTTTTKAADDVIAWTQSVIDDVSNWVPEGSKDFVWIRSANPRGWVQGAFLVGMKDWATTTDNEAHWDWLKSYAEAQSFQLGDRMYNADDHVVAQYYIALAEKFNISEALDPVTELFDYLVSPSNFHEVSLDHTIEPSEELDALDYGRQCQYRWCWCDALFMSPPGFVALSEVTGDPKYREFAHSEYFVTTDLLFREFDDMPGGLYLRDSSFDDTMYDTEENKLDENGNLIFWSRGNGWVFAGLPAILRALPEDFAERDRYLSIFESMAQALRALQVTEGEYTGFWGPSLRAFDLFPTPEASGTAFFVGGIAWGIAEGILPADEYLNTVMDGWQALLTVQAEDGSIGWTQQIGSEPESVTADGVQLYSAGGFLQAASGMLRLHEMGLLGTTTVPDDPAHTPTTTPSPNDSGTYGFTNSAFVEEVEQTPSTPQPHAFRMRNRRADTAREREQGTHTRRPRGER